MVPYVLQRNPTKDDKSWKFNIPPENLVTQNRTNFGKLMIFTADKITLETAQLPANRILRGDDSTKFILLSFRFPGSTLREMSEYIRGRSCFVREATSDAELDAWIYALGDFGNIMNPAKRAKRIGLPFPEAKMDWKLDPKYVVDIPDIKSGDEVLRRPRRALYTYSLPDQVMLHPELDHAKKHLAAFRKSMKKFRTHVKTGHSRS